MLAELGVEPVAQRVARHRIGIVVERDIGARGLAAIGIGHADHERLLHRGMAVEHVLDMLGEDLEPADGDHVLEAIDPVTVPAAP